MDVACSTRCFADQPLELALRRIAELEFAKVDLEVRPVGAQVTYTELADGEPEILERIHRGPTIGFAAISVGGVDSDADVEEAVDRCGHLAKQLAAPVLVVEAGPKDRPIDEEVQRLRRLERIASMHGTVLTVLTKTGTLTEFPAPTIELCKRVDGLGVTLDPSHYVWGPNQAQNWDDVYPYVRHLHLRDTGRGRDQFQVRVGRGEIEYSRIVHSLGRSGFHGSLCVSIDRPEDPDLDGQAEVRKLRLVLESLV